ncbi:hypothetical protein K2173_013369 [Erythroxylum novogranatense]|uniref:Uncharacterized protein n=1 Tax=Erythroxylum novogranatense TaxID=1862640 RepID=A0AAV8S9U9_9ROSI|nr:hypothetical protein K2173_013369 [Erythroxylum novogranatense]
MALNNPHPKVLECDVIGRSTEVAEAKEEEEKEEEDIEEKELEDLESEVKLMAKKILEYRATLPSQFKTTLASLLSSQRSVIGLDTEPGPSGGSNPGSEARVETSKAAVPLIDDETTREKVRLLKGKISSNVSAMPVLIRRMKECLSRIENLGSSNGTIHPAFKRKRNG